MFIAAIVGIAGVPHLGQCRQAQDLEDAVSKAIVLAETAGAVLNDDDKERMIDALLEQNEYSITINDEEYTLAVGAVD